MVSHTSWRIFISLSRAQHVNDSIACVSSFSILGLISKMESTFQNSSSCKLTQLIDKLCNFQSISLCGAHILVVTLQKWEFTKQIGTVLLSETLLFSSLLQMYTNIDLAGVVQLIYRFEKIQIYHTQCNATQTFTIRRLLIEQWKQSRTNR